MAKFGLYEFEGEMLSAKTIAGRVSLSPATIYKYLGEGYTIYEAIELGKKNSAVVFKNRKKTNNRNPKKYLYKDGVLMTVEEISELEGISKDALYVRLKQGLPLEEAVAEIKRNIAPKFPYLGGMYSKWMLARLTGVSKHYLKEQIDDSKKYTEEEIKRIIEAYKSPEINMYQGMSLYQYCVKMRYNYNVIRYSMKAYGLTAEEAIEQYLLCGQRVRFSHKYLLGDILLYHFLMKMQIDCGYVTDKIRKGRSETDAIVDAIFLNNENYKNRSTRTKLRAIYGQIKSIQQLFSIQSIYGLDAEDINFLRTKFIRAQDVLEQYKLFSIVATAQAIDNTDDLKDFLSSVDVTIEELSDIKEELLEGFVKIDYYTKGKQIKYIWHKEN